VRFVVYGAGAVGGVIGARLHLAGHHVALVARGRHLATVREEGLRLESAEGGTSVRLPVGTSLADLDVGDDTCVLVTVKGQDTAAVLPDLVAHLPTGATVACVQNGVANERSALRSFEHVLGVCVMLPATHLEPGVVVAKSSPVPGMLDVGCYPDGTDERAEELASAFRDSGFDSVARADIMAWKHRKLVSNLGNAVQAAYRPGEERDRLSEQVREEGEQVLAAAGIPCVTREQDAERRDDILSPGAVGGRGGGSTWQSLARGTGAVETDWLNGEIILLGRLHRLPAPANALVRAAVLDLARRRAEPSTLSAADALAALAV
jgi:2-dehydropantoate 2-reductase